MLTGDAAPSKADSAAESLDHEGAEDGKLSGTGFTDDAHAEMESAQSSAIQTVMGTAMGMTGNTLVATLKVNGDMIISCVIEDDEATAEMKKGYDLAAEAVVGMQTSHAAGATARELVQDIKAYAQTVGSKLSNGGDDRLSAQFAAEAIKDALQTLDEF